MADVFKAYGNVLSGDFAGKHVVLLDQDEYDMLIALLNSSAWTQSSEYSKLRDDLEIY